MSAQPKTVKRDPKAKWPEGWEAEAERLASFYLRIIKGINEHDVSLAQKRLAAKQMERLRTHGEQFSSGLRDLIDCEDADRLVRMHRTRTARRGISENRRGELDRLLVYVLEIRSLTTAIAEVADDLAGAGQLLAASDTLEMGNQSTLALRFTIAAASAAYSKLFKKPPGRSRSDYGTFGRFVLEVIARTPEHCRPARPSPSAISDVVGEWQRRRQPVAR